MDAVLRCFQSQLPDELVAFIKPFLKHIENGNYQEILNCDQAKSLFGHVRADTDPGLDQSRLWSDSVFDRIGVLCADREKKAQQAILFCIGYSGLLAFLQSNATGPPLSFSPSQVILPEDISANNASTEQTRDLLLKSLGTDGIAAYRLTPNPELLCLADIIMTAPAVLKYTWTSRWAKMRVAFIQQRLLSELSSTLQTAIYGDLEMLERTILNDDGSSHCDAQTKAEFLIERAGIHIHHGFDKLARQDLEHAARLNQFEFAITGILGKRTKFQQKDVSQLVVLARSAEFEDSNGSSSSTNGGMFKHDPIGGNPSDKSDKLANGRVLSQDTENDIKTTPANLMLNDDTLLESISFTEKPQSDLSSHGAAALSPNLSSLDPSQQPMLNPLDSTILLSMASSITNTSPEDGLTREETLPYATRVIDGGSSNWQVYTQALLVRSRIEGYKSRTVERGLLQLQALVDQVIADTTTATSDASSQAGNAVETRATSFLRKSKDDSETAPASERLRYIFQLASPTRWDLEAELANRWVQLGGMRSALDIFERLEMWAEAALCWAATEREDKAKKILRRQLYHATDNRPDSETTEDETWMGSEREPLPNDAPRLFCILGDLNQDVNMWERSWDCSKHHYARAQRSLGRYYLASKDLLKSAAAYSKSLKANQLHHASWFALGCVLLELGEHERAAAAFSRCVQLDDTDAEAWSNFAAALLKLDPNIDDTHTTGFSHRLDDEEEDVVNVPTAKRSPQKNRQDALKALMRAASLKQDSYRIWQNVLVVAASLSPPDFASILAAQRNVIILRGKVDGEQCVDFEILDSLVQHIISMNETYNPTQPGLARMVVKFIDTSVVPLITASADLWRMVSKLALWRNNPLTALEAEEKAWRAITTQPGWETESESGWNAVVEATVRLCDSYESLGPKQRTEGMSAGELVAKDWKFKARSAVRGILGRGKDSFEDSDGWTRLQDTMQDLRG